VQVEDVGLRRSICRGQDVVVAVAVFAGRGFFVALGMPDPVNAGVVLLQDVVVTPAAVQLQWVSVVVWKVFEILGASVTVRAEQILVHGSIQDGLIDEETEALEAFTVPFELLVIVAAHAVVSGESLIVALAVDRFLDLRGGQPACGAERDYQEEERTHHSIQHGSSSPKPAEAELLGERACRLAVVGGKHA
jgi:hypothetical protein